MPGKLILIVEDDIITQNMLRTAVAGAGYEPVIAASGGEAIHLANERAPDLIILDIMLPDIDGGEVASLLRQDTRTRTIPIIFLSSLISDAEAMETSVGDTAFLAKPINRVLLLNQIKRYL